MTRKAKRKFSGTANFFRDLRDVAIIGIMVPVFIAWTFGGFAGALWAGINGDLVSVVLSIFIPGYGVFYCVSQLL